LRPVDAADIDQLLEQAPGVVAQEGDQRDQLVRPGVEHQLAQANVGGHHGVAGRLSDVVAELLQRFGHQRTSVPVRRTFFCSWRTP
jgi:hypothetical protein